MAKTNFRTLEYPNVNYFKVKRQCRNCWENWCVDPQSYIGGIFTLQIRNQKASNPAQNKNKSVQRLLDLNLSSKSILYSSMNYYANTDHSIKCFMNIFWNSENPTVKHFKKTKSIFTVVNLRTIDPFVKQAEHLVWFVVTCY